MKTTLLGLLVFCAGSLVFAAGNSVSLWARQSITIEAESTVLRVLNSTDDEYGTVTCDYHYESAVLDRQLLSGSGPSITQEVISYGLITSADLKADLKVAYGYETKKQSCAEIADEVKSKHGQVLDCQKIANAKEAITIITVFGYGQRSIRCRSNSFLKVDDIAKLFNKNGLFKSFMSF